MSSDPDDTPAATARGLTKSFAAGTGQVQALRGIDMTVPRGSLYMLVGPSGCGKTTLISVLGGLLDRDGGDCRVLGVDLSALELDQRTDFRARHIGFVFQAFNLLPALNAAENVAVPLIINRRPRSKAVAEAAELLSAMGMADKLKSLPTELSGGQQQRVAIARALIHRPELIVCDEPTSALDHETGERVMQVMRDMVMGGGRTLVIVTHDARILGHADYIAHMEDGRILHTETRANHARQRA